MSCVRWSATKGDGPVLLAKYGAEERKGGSGGRGGAHPVRLSELPMIFLPNRLFAPAPVKREVDGGDAMKGTWAIEKVRAFLLSLCPFVWLLPLSF